MEDKTVILSGTDSLVGQDLTNVYRHFKLSPTVTPANVTAKFKKKETLNTLTKAMLKHRIKTLTGKSTKEIEDEIGYKSPDGLGFSVEHLRKMAHFLILQAAEELPVLAASPEKVGRKRGALDEDTPDVKRCRTDDLNQSVQRSTPKRTRKSLAPEVFRNREKVDCRLKKELKVEVENMDFSDLNLGPNPTPQMIARKRRSMAATPTANSTRISPRVKATKKNKPVDAIVASTTLGATRDVAAVTQTDVQPVKKGRKSIANVLIDAVLSPLQRHKELNMGFSGADDCQVYIGQSEIASFKLETFKSVVKDFNGANLIVLHTPSTWDPTDVFSLVQAVRLMNKTCKLDTFTILVGCAITNVHLFREALYRQTKHVQFVVFDREDADPNHNKSKLRDVNSYFLLAYFFEGCNNLDATDIPQMVRPGTTTCFKTDCVEGLENKIVDTFTEKGDWIMDLFCGERELLLAAQKAGRNAIAVNNRAEPLKILKEKASAIAAHVDPQFDPAHDGIVLQF